MNQSLNQQRQYKFITWYTIIYMNTFLCESITWLSYFNVYMNTLVHAKQKCRIKDSSNIIVKRKIKVRRLLAETRFSAKLEFM